MQEKFLSRNVKRETDEHYRGGWPVNADARRFLYLKYANYPREIADARNEEYKEIEPKNMWQEIAQVIIDEFGDGQDKIGIDVGASSGYFIDRLLNSGYRGAIVGVDIETGHQQFLHQQTMLEHPGANVLFGEANATSLREIRVRDDDENVVNTLKIKSDSVDFLTELFVLYHVGDYEAAYRAAHRVLKPGGLAVFSGRHPWNQEAIWNLGAVIAQEYNVKPPTSFYLHHSVDDMERYLQDSSRFELLDVVPQANHIWIPSKDEAGEQGWLSVKMALASLPYGTHRLTGKSIVNKKFLDYLDAVIKPEHFDANAEANNGFYIDTMIQSYFVCRAIK